VPAKQVIRGDRTSYISRRQTAPGRPDPNSRADPSPTPAWRRARPRQGFAPSAPLRALDEACARRPAGYCRRVKSAPRGLEAMGLPIGAASMVRPGSARAAPSHRSPGCLVSPPVVAPVGQSPAQAVRGALRRSRPKKARGARRPGSVEVLPDARVVGVRVVDVVVTGGSGTGRRRGLPAGARLKHLDRRRESGDV